ncbi:EGF domain-specific O-linked N-acetylglucosamine transferase isoform X1 [Parasteatoda tepidariorum]|uniref:EGF domain-specific O-linked N-acetylglucosamine transferase isoform X1 n=1 Tax=Parasteatoda tepidariorum TaxID=114398 RepID=UPI001C7287CC|nr:EGF domain-specific O-linked N-acetylglucosamine transferase [Parasteatoda tepidariorum]
MLRFKMFFLCLMSIIITCLITLVISNSHILELNLPPEHIPYYFSNHPIESQNCANSDSCSHKGSLGLNKCWGYEKGCSESDRFSTPDCNQSSKGWAKSKKEQSEIFFHQGDFGYIQDRLNEMKVLCSTKHKNASYLECSQHMRFCRGKYLMFDFHSLEDIPEPMRYRDDVIREGQVGGHCKLKKKLLKQQGQHKSPLQSWYAEFEHFTELPELPKDQNLCDIIINQPTFIMKLDAAVNMYHHFCDFLNLYATLHMNQTFSTDVQILIWDTIPYMSNFAPVWKAFTQHPLMNLGSLKGKRVCFKDVVFPLLPRMIFGMYYNMPLIPGCQGSGLFRAFAQHIKHRLQIPDLFFDSKIRVTLISRSTQYRRILNEDELISSLKVYPELLVKKVNFNRQMSFTEQLKISYNTDILIGIHGAGLTHMLFMPEWGSVFEIFNCEDESCYADLARLKGLKYLTWEKLDKLYPEDEGHHPTLGAHAKFTNYSFDVKEFLRIFKKLMNHVKQHPAFQQKRNICHGTTCNKTFIHNEL